jgi:uncharacterized protein
MPIEFQIFVKPTGPRCNLNCSYCYYLGKKELYPGADHYRMKSDFLEKYIIQHIEATTDETIMFSWHGGEPILAGIEFYKLVVALQKKYLPSGKKVLNGIQTNGTLLNEEWCHFLAKENFIVGLSLDGPEKLHDFHRKDKSGRGSFHQVLKGFQCLRDHGITPEILCVVSSQNCGHPLEVYNFIKGLGVRYVTFLPLVNVMPGSDTVVTSDSVPSEAFGRFLVAVFDEWVEKDIGTIEIQIFEEAIRTAFNQEHTLCIFKENCGGVPVIEHNGDFYSCDHYVDKEHLVDNIRDKTIIQCLESPQQEAFGKAKSKTLPRYCRECPVKLMCNGECPKNRFNETPDGESGLNYLCKGYKMFFEHCRPFVDMIRELSM